MTEQKKTAECHDLEVQHSARGQNVSLSQIITNIGTLIRGIAKLVELIETLIGEMKLNREAAEKTAKQMKRVADIFQQYENDCFTKNELLSETAKDVNHIRGHLGAIQPEIHRIVNGCKADHPEGDWHV